MGVSLGGPGGDLVSDRLFVGDASIEASRGEDAKSGFSQVEPGAVFGRVAPFEALDQAPGLGGGKGLVKRCGCVRVEVVLDKDDRCSLRKVDVGQVFQIYGAAGGREVRIGLPTIQPRRPRSGGSSGSPTASSPDGSKRGSAPPRDLVRRIAIVALARKLMVPLWRYLKTGLVPDGAVLSPSF